MSKVIDKGCSNLNGDRQSGVFDYLCVDAFLQNMVGVQAIKCAFQLGLIDRLMSGGKMSFDTLAGELQADRSGLRVLCELLLAERALGEDEHGIGIQSAFDRALQFRDLIEAKIDFADMVAPDLIDHFNLLVNDPGSFMEHARVFALFDYRKCLERTQANYDSTKRWMRFTTTLTKYESDVCAYYHDFSRYHRMLDIGGNSGEFVLRLCKQHPKLSANVLDLPLVCDVGQAHIAGEPEAERVEFVSGSILEGDLPAGFDVISFKSMLHDWPHELVVRMLTRATECLSPGGTIMIFERAPMHLRDSPMAYSLIPMLLFFRSFRDPTIYQRQLEALGYSAITTHMIDLESPFFLMTATKG